MKRRFQFSLRTLLIVTMILAVGCAIGGEQIHGYLGAETPIDAEPQAKGVRIAEISKGGPAAKAGLQVGDTITSIDGIAVTDYHTIRKLIRDQRPGSTVKATIERAGSEMSFGVTVGILPKNGPFDTFTIDGGFQGFGGTHIIHESSQTIIKGSYEIKADENLLEIEIGPSPDRICLDVRDEVMLAGTLRVRAIDFSPQENEKFVLISSGKAVTGSFKKLDLPKLHKGLQWKISYEDRLKATDQKEKDKVGVSLLVVKAGAEADHP